MYITHLASSAGKRLLLLVAGAILLFSTTIFCAQLNPGDLQPPPEGKIQIMNLSDGSQLFGRITESDADSIRFQTEMATLSIAIENIVSIEMIDKDQVKDGKYWFKNPNTTRLFYGPTGRTLGAGEGYFTDLLLFFPGVAFGITDNIDIGAGMTIFPGVDFEDQIYYITPKIGFKAADKLDVAAAATIFRVPDFDDDDDEDDDDFFESPEVVGILYGVGTYGTGDASLTFGLGFGWTEEELADNPAVLLGGEVRIARRFSLVSENWLFPQTDTPLISYGIRFFGESLSADLALINVLDEDAIFPGFPMVGFTWNF